ncbi:glycosyltransferase [Cryobacterium sp. GrIS_2_6]|uniref:glycosyltransferase n=1 Tax=Cryobacterium sp. GrIS_2_6 TaxID=3162785 RepID=UPI002E08BEA1|nr:glycosyltransferase [Cryobacterium psychrotolerans]MEC5151147.1 glycosyltransferase involved in cell wall biosynthesis [Cryobacterium psychrotolerans]
MRIVNVVTLASQSGRYGGPLEVALSQTSIAAELGFESVLVCGFVGGDYPQALSLRGDVRLRRVHQLIPKSNFTGLHSWALFRSQVREIRVADIVHIGISREFVPISALLIARIYRKNIVLQPHGMLTSRTSVAHHAVDLFLRPAIGFHATFAALTVVEANQLRSWAGGLKPRIFILGNPVPDDVATLTDCTESDGNMHEVLFLARLHPRKRVGLFLDAAHFAEDAGWNDHYVVVGPDEGELPLVLSAQARSRNICYEGPLAGAEVTRRIQRAKVFVLSSENEPWGHALTAALALGKPVVVTASTALSSDIEKFGAGRVVSDDSPHALARAVHELLDNPEHYQSAQAGATRLTEALLNSQHYNDSLRGLYAQRFAKGTTGHE